MDHKMCRGQIIPQRRMPLRNKLLHVRLDSRSPPRPPVLNCRRGQIDRLLHQLDQLRVTVARGKQLERALKFLRTVRVRSSPPEPLLVRFDLLLDVGQLRVLHVVPVAPPDRREQRPVKKRIYVTI
uniref:(northern house mosquito) hypothetical protein n=1 Tax=Culex pipiens TaxID=7175 RepID=A0A8D7ZS95_CULPI